MKGLTRIVPIPLRPVLMDERTVQLRSPEETETLGGRLARLLLPGTVIWLKGPLGAGKTTLVRGLLRALGWRGPVRSPTFTLKEPYKTERLRLVHYDLYRIGAPEELEWLGLRDDLDGETVLLFEWPERGGAVLPPADLVIELDHHPGGRLARLVAKGARGKAILAQLESHEKAGGSAHHGRLARRGRRNRSRPPSGDFE